MPQCWRGTHRGNPQLAASQCDLFSLCLQKVALLNMQKFVSHFCGIDSEVFKFLMHKSC